jgi:hypothetical protein
LRFWKRTRRICPGQQVPPGSTGPQASAMNSMGQMSGGQQPPGAQNTPPVKGAHAAAQAALAAAVAASGRPQPVRSNMTSPQRMFSPQNINHNVYNSIPNSSAVVVMAHCTYLENNSAFLNLGTFPCLVCSDNLKLKICQQFYIYIYISTPGSVVSVSYC